MDGGEIKTLGRINRTWESFGSRGEKKVLVGELLPISKNTLYYIDHAFFKKWLKNHPKFLLHFLIHIDVLMLCRKFELIPTKSF